MYVDVRYGLGQSGAIGPLIDWAHLGIGRRFLVVHRAQQRMDADPGPGGARLLALILTAFVGTGYSAVSTHAQIVIQTVPIGNLGNANDPMSDVGEGTRPFGGVAYAYGMGTTEVTNAQYAAFLNAVARSDPNSLYNANMAGSLGGIVRTGTAGSFLYSTISGRENNPVNYVTFWDSCRFTNWLHNGQPTGAAGPATTEGGAYTLTASGIADNTVARNADALWAIPSADEWHKAAYHQPASLGGDADDYWLYPTSSNSISTADAAYGNISPNATPVPVGSFAPNFYGVFDMGGNVYEWNEYVLTGPAGSLRTFRGGTVVGNESFLLSSFVGGDLPTGDSRFGGFRVVQVPAPAGALVFALGAVAATRRTRRD